jgi:ammonium transporter, Amt family
MVVCCFSNVNEWLHIDDGLEVFKLHGIGGMVGGFLTGIFATSRISSLDGATIASGAIDGNGIQVAKQLAEICAVSAYSFTASVAMLMILKYIPGMHLRVPDEVEAIGYDMDQFHEETIGEWALWEQDNHGVIEGVQPSQSPAEQVDHSVSEKA